MSRTRSSGLAVLALCAVLVAAGSHPALAQDYNYVPGWADTHNHRYKGDGETGEWSAKTELFAKLRSSGPAARCALANLSEPDGNLIVNRYRSQVRKTNEQAALNWAHQQVAVYHRLLMRQGRCPERQ
ncbi:hypothetical protein [Novosphingobium sp. P6W]|uniref:hypothetical protein n=1 Tax=Novosphingobium sp. P6W TaxID=1609758 RepID=UPI0005C528AA|nr:hypothetical protein [Novosphingobium sp. P6W]AXB79013.1 hypothetical protein TQ38_020875 [Novosphingobium sp. P6W]